MIAVYAITGIAMKDFPCFFLCYLCLAREEPGNTGNYYSRGSAETAFESNNVSNKWNG